MSRRLRIVLTGVLLVAAGVAAVASSAGVPSEPVPASVQSALDEITGKPVYEHSIWGYRVIDLNSGEVLLSQNADKMFVTGSILKMYSTSTALDVLGPDYRFSTPVYRRGTVARGSLSGDLILVASGDYSFGLRERPDGTAGYNSFPEIDHNYADTGLPGPALLPDSHPLSALEELAREVRASGIRRVAGNVVIDDRLYETFDGWPDGLMSPMWVNENVIDITATPTGAGQPAAVDWRPKTAAVRVVSQVQTVSGEGSPLVVDSPRRGVVRISGQISVDGGPVLSIWQIPDPAAFARTAFIEALERAGVRVDARATGPNPGSLLPRSRTYQGSNRVAEHVSLPLSEYVKVILKVSFNRGADEMVCIVAVAKGSTDCLDGLVTELATIMRLGVSPVTTLLFDGAGSSEYDRSTPLDYTTFLRNATKESWYLDLRGGMAILGVDGTAATSEAGTPAAGHVFVKDGTRVAMAPPTHEHGILSALTKVGYIDAKSGRQLAFALFLRDVPLSSDLAEFFAGNVDEGVIMAAIQQGY